MVALSVFSQRTRAGQTASFWEACWNLIARRLLRRNCDSLLLEAFAKLMTTQGLGVKSPECEQSDVDELDSSFVKIGGSFSRVQFIYLDRYGLSAACPATIFFGRSHVPSFACWLTRHALDWMDRVPSR
jgi:hypothetical protein